MNAGLSVCLYQIALILCGMSKASTQKESLVFRYILRKNVTIRIMCLARLSAIAVCTGSHCAQASAPTESVLHNFNKEGEVLYSPLIIDGKGALYGTITDDFRKKGCGSVFRLKPPPQQGKP